MKRIVIVLLALTVSSLLPGRAFAEQKIAYVDLQRAMEETNEGKAALAALNAESAKNQKEFEQRQAELKKLKADIDRQRGVLKPEVIAARDQEVQLKTIELQQTWARMQQDLQKKQTDRTQRILTKMSKVIAEIAQAGGVTYVFERNSGLLYAPPSLDLTRELILKFDAAPTK